MNFIELFFIFLTIILLFLYLKNYYAEVTYVKSSVDGEFYLVRRLHDKQKAADTLGRLATDMEKLIKHLLAKYPDDPNVKRLYQNFNKKAISESSPDSGYTSYTVDKGKRMMLCLRQKDSAGTFVDYNVLVMTTIHELAHSATLTIGHDQTFWDNNKLLLREAVEIGIYTKVDFNKQPADFCGIKITSSVI